MQAGGRNKAPPHRWTKEETKMFLDMIIDDIADSVDKFEKPTAFRYYDGLRSKFPPSLQGLAFNNVKNKMSYLKGLYAKALNWKNNTGNGLTENDSEESIQAYIDHMCPFFQELDVIFGQKKNVRPAHIVDTAEEHLENVGDLDQLISYSPEPQGDIPIENVEPNEEASGFIEENFAQQDEHLGHASTKRRKKTPALGAATVLMEMQEKRFEAEEKRITLQNDIEKDKLEIEKEKMQDQKNQWKEEMALRKREVDVSLLLKEKEFQNAITIRNLELQYDERITKMKLDAEERLKKYELDLKFKK